MKYSEIKDIVLGIVQEADGLFICSYQICKKVEESYPDVWEKLCVEYPSISEEVEIGAGTGHSYSPASFIANTLKYYSPHIAQLEQEYFSCEGVSIEGVSPNITSQHLGIWAWKNRVYNCVTE